jgi:hypothetical protein
MIAKFLNENCACRTFDPELLKSHLESDELLNGLFEQITESRPNLFSATTVFISPAQLTAMTTTIEAIEETIKNDLFKKKALEFSPIISQLDKGPKGVFMGYDFHISDDGPKLIEINTNAGGALLNLELAKAQQKCCQDKNLFFKTPEDILKLDQSFIDMFLNEWKEQRGETLIGLIAILDDNPQAQYLYPEFQLFQRLFTKFGLKSVIADPKELLLKNGVLWHHGEKVDLVYNRLTDFYFEEENHQAIKKAFEINAIVLTPSPYHHALYANKINLATLSNKASLENLRIPQKTQDLLLSGIPHTQAVTMNNANDLWERRRELFFKPVSGFGSKATYRGDKMTRKVWDEILRNEYVAQYLIAPSKRIIQNMDNQTDLKLDLRAYVYEGKIQLLAARLYSGQTTNFRTSGGGFAPVFVIQSQSI